MKSCSIFRAKLGNVEKFLSIKGFGFVSGDDGSRYYFSRGGLGHNPMMVFGGERVRFEAIHSDKTPHCVTMTQADGTPFDREMQYGVFFRTPDGGTVCAGLEQYSVTDDDIEQRDIFRGGNSAAPGVGLPVNFYLDGGKPQSIIRAIPISRKRIPEASSGKSVESIFDEPVSKKVASGDDADIAQLLDSFEMK